MRKVNLKRRDLINTILVLLVLGVYLTATRGLDFPLIGSYRGGSFVVGLLGILMGIVNTMESDAELDFASPWVSFPMLFATMTFVMIIWGVVVGTALPFVFLVGVTLVTWGMVTIHHLVERGVHGPKVVM